MLRNPHEYLSTTNTFDNFRLCARSAKIIILVYEKLQKFILRWRKAINWKLVTNLLSGFLNLEFNGNWINLKKMVTKLLHDMMELNLILPSKNLEQLSIRIDVSPCHDTASGLVLYLRFLEPIRLNVLPECPNNLCSALLLDAQDPLQLST
jgi:hypothetical protein